MSIRRAFASFFVLLLCVPCLWAASVRERVADEAYDIGPMMEAFYDDTMGEDDPSYWDSFTVSLITASKDSPLYSWFGHAALVVEGPGFDSVMFDYGSFRFGANFYANFAMGRLMYTCEANLAEYRINYMTYKMRTIRKTVLNLTPEQKKGIVCYLESNSLPENKTYLYHNYKDNCATRIRDLINTATDGAFEEWARSIDGYTCREQVSRILNAAPAVNYVLDLLQGPSIDEEGSLWTEMFLPECLEEAVLSYPGLALSTELITDFRGLNGRSENLEVPKTDTSFPVLVAVLLVALTLPGLLLFRRRWYGIATCAINFVLGIVGTLLLFMMVFTLHDYTWWNQNILFVNPLLLAMAVMSLGTMARRKGDPARSFMRLRTCYRILFFTMAGLTVLKLVLPTVFHQANWCQILSIMPYYALNAFFPVRKD